MKYLMMALSVAMVSSVWGTGVPARTLLPVIPQVREFKVDDDGEFCDVLKAKVSFDRKAKPHLGEEGYEMELDDDEIEIEVGGKVGRVRAKATLAQLKEAAKRGEKIPCGKIVDSPKYRMRGLVFDVGRKFHSLDFLYRVAKAMSYYKMNVLHVHLNDCTIEKNPKADWSTKYAAFRLESEKFPQLTSKDGFYTKKDFRKFIKDCEKIGVTVIPEIDAPAHALCFDRAFGLGSVEHGKDHLDLVNKLDECVKTMTEVLAEYLTGPDPVFANHYCHIGTDEYSRAAAEQFRSYTDQMIKAVEKMGGKVCMWGSLTHAKGKTPVKASKDIIVDIWSKDYYRPQEALDAGYSVVSVPDSLVYIVPKAGYYYNYLNLQHLYNNWEPNEFVQGFKIDPNHPQLMGGKFAIWHDLCDKSCDEQGSWDRVFPAIQTLGQKFWSGKVEGESWEDFSKLMKETRSQF